MRKKDNKKSSGRKMIEAVGISVVIGYLFSMLILLLFSVLISKETVSEEFGKTAVIISLFIGSLFGGLAAAKTMGRNPALMGLYTALGIIVIRVLCSCANVNAEVFSSFSLITYGIVLAGGIIGGAFGKKKKKYK